MPMGTCPTCEALPPLCFVRKVCGDAAQEAYSTLTIDEARPLVADSTVACPAGTAAYATRERRNSVVDVLDMDVALWQRALNASRIGFGFALIA